MSVSRVSLGNFGGQECRGSSESTTRGSDSAVCGPADWA
ncbi:MAG: hypothetical protein RL215_687 [Planctomycetota bacterium]